MATTRFACMTFRRALRATGLSLACGRQCKGVGPYSNSRSTAPRRTNTWPSHLPPRSHYWARPGGSFHTCPYAHPPTRAHPQSTRTCTRRKAGGRRCAEGQSGGAEGRSGGAEGRFGTHGSGTVRRHAHYRVKRAWRREGRRGRIGRMHRTL